MGGREKQGSSFTVERSETEDTMAGGKRQIWMACVALWGHLMSWPVMQPRAKSGSMALPQLGSMLMSKAHVATEGSVDSSCPDHYLKVRWSLRVMLSLGPY